MADTRQVKWILKYESTGYMEERILHAAFSDFSCTNPFVSKAQMWILMSSLYETEIRIQILCETFQEL